MCLHDGASGLIGASQPPGLSDGAHENAAYPESHGDRETAATCAVAQHLVAASASCCKHGRRAGAASPLGWSDSPGYGLQVQGFGLVFVLLVSVAWLGDVSRRAVEVVSRCHEPL